MRELKTLVTGANGQLGWELQHNVPQGVEVIPFTSAELDVTDQRSVESIVEEASPEIIVNAAAYTAVDRAEQDCDRAHAVNCQGAVNLGKVAVKNGVRLVHISTDFIFDGMSAIPYLPNDKPNPLGVYGASKLAGEQALQVMLPALSLTILRTSWVYSAHGANFVKTMLSLMAERESLGVVVDQIGTPTWAAGLAATVWQVIEKDVTGIYHCSDAGVASWYDFAVAIQEEALALGVLAKEIAIKPINSSAYPTPAKRPASSVLDKSSLWQQLDSVPVHWRVSLRKMLKELKESPKIK